MNRWLEHLPPVVISEVTSHVLAMTPDLRELVNADDAELTGEQTEAMLVGVWLNGYANGIGDTLDAEDGKKTPLITWAMEQGAKVEGGG